MQAVWSSLLPVVALIALGFGTGGLGLLLSLASAPLTVMVAAALPIGANVFLFSQRYGVARQLTTASVAVSNVLGLATLSLVLGLLKLLPA